MIGESSYQVLVPDASTGNHHFGKELIGHLQEYLGVSPQSSSCAARANTALQRTQVLQLIQLIQTSLDMH
jgi:hypothetical protein